MFKRRTIQFENNESEEDSLVRQATLRTIRCTTNPMDLVCVELAGGRFASNLFLCIKKDSYFSIYSFLSAGWGFISDVDIESEKLRWMGDTRCHWIFCHIGKKEAEVQNQVFIVECLCSCQPEALQRQTFLPSGLDQN